MIWALLIGLVTLTLVGAGVVLLIRRFRGVKLVLPMLLDDALDPDLRRVRKQLRTSRHSLQTRRILGRQLLDIAARRAKVGPSDHDRDRDELRRLSKAVRERRGAARS